MNDRHDRRSLLIGGGALAVLNAVRAGAQQAATEAPTAPEKNAGPPPNFPRQEPELVLETVAVSHGRFDRLQKLVEVRPALAKAAVDWGFGN